MWIKLVLWKFELKKFGNSWIIWILKIWILKKCELKRTGEMFQSHFKINSIFFINRIFMNF